MNHFKGKQFQQDVIIVAVGYYLTIKYLNNLTEQDHRPVKRRNKFYRSLRTASTTIKGMEAIRGLYKKTRKEGTLFGFSVCTEIKVLLGIPA